MKPMELEKSVAGTAVARPDGPETTAVAEDEPPKPSGSREARRASAPATDAPPGAQRKANA